MIYDMIKKKTQGFSSLNSQQNSKGIKKGCPAQLQEGINMKEEATSEFAGSQVFSE